MGKAWGYCYGEVLRCQEEDRVILVKTIGDTYCSYVGNQSSKFTSLTGQRGVY